MYLDYWGLQRPPFENVTDPDIFYRSESHLEGLTRLIYTARMGKGCALLSGEMGCGKTTLAMLATEKIGLEKDCDTGIIVNPCQDPTEFIQDVAAKLKAPTRANTKFGILQALQEKLTENERAGKSTLLVVDEAQILPDRTLEEVRLLLNFQSSQRSLLTIFLLGEPALLSRIKRGNTIKYQIAVSFFLKAFNLKETAGYIFFRQRMAGLNQNVFSKQAIEMIFTHSKGIPGAINRLCDLALLAGFGIKQKKVNVTLLKDVIQDGAI